jgi:hypothetical protein
VFINSKLSKEIILERLKDHPEKIVDAFLQNKIWRLSVFCKLGHNYTPSLSNFTNRHSRCRICSFKKNAESNYKNQGELLKTIKEKHNIDLVCLNQEYVGLATKATFKCHKHGEFIASFVICDQVFGCKRCGKESTCKKIKKDFVFIKEYIEKKGYKVINTSYRNNKSPLMLECPKHGEFRTMWNSISSGHWCRKCGSTANGIKNRMPEEKLIELSNTLGYRFIKRLNLLPKSQKIVLECPIHGEFVKSINHLKSGGGCGKCNTKSFKEDEIVDFIKTLGVEVLSRDRSVLKRKELDIYIPSKKLAIEYNGLYWHSERYAKPLAHYDKYKECREAGINLMGIFEDEWLNPDKQILIKEMIKNRLGIFPSNKVRASKLTVKKITKCSDVKYFFDKFHLDGYVKSSFGYGLYLEDSLISCAMFRKHIGSGNWEISRFCSDYNYLVHGALGRILKNIDIKGTIISYSNNRFSSGNIYKTIGFEEKTITTQPSYWYTDNKVRIFRTKCKRINELDILEKYPTEQKQALGGVFSRKYLNHSKPLYKIYDYGHKRWELQVNNLNL